MKVPVGYTPGDDYLKPGRIMDLKTSDLSFDDGTVTLIWLAPGDDLDSGAGMYFRRRD